MLTTRLKLLALAIYLLVWYKLHGRLWVIFGGILAVLICGFVGSNQ